MADNQITLAQPATLFLSNVPVEVPAGTVVTFPTANTRDQLAGDLAQNQRVYAENRAQLAHEEIAERVFEGAVQRVRVRVTYGIAGARAEEILGPAPEEEPAVVAPEPEQPAEPEVAEPEQAAPAFEVGDVVRQKGSAVQMTVVGPEGDGFRCSWNEGEESHSEVFAADTLLLVERPA